MAASQIHWGENINLKLLAFSHLDLQAGHRHRPNCSLVLSSVNLFQASLSRDALGLNQLRTSRNAINTHLVGKTNHFQRPQKSEIPASSGTSKATERLKASWVQDQIRPNYSDQSERWFSTCLKYIRCDHLPKFEGKSNQIEMFDRRTSALSCWTMDNVYGQDATADSSICSAEVVSPAASARDPLLRLG